eukprot:TRINITY_DN27165_c0_g1_i1.p1 TRINITY_DN27165_c0_g1~~TRINITY_DN27165_c0_g1_i1.p1  ORF type:complete len:282 (+),score=53.57 TRINITY_DN27165_c0_g1_i1:60-905(+)
MFWMACAAVVVLVAALGACWDALPGWAVDCLADAFTAVAVPAAKRWLRVPENMYFVMDGNRRWAKQKHQPTLTGHTEGYETLKRLLQVLSDLGVREVTVYAFSVQNFRRGEEEKAYLMQLARQRLEEMVTREDVISKHDVRVRVVGERGMLPRDVVEAAARAEAHTAHRQGCTLNIAFAYASRQELVHYARTGKLHVDAHDASPHPPLFVRTSGEQRFSDFLTWQSACAHLCFQKILWPDYRPWHLMAALLDYNVHYEATKHAHDAHRTDLLAAAGAQCLS